MNSINDPIGIIQAQWLKTGVVVEFSDNVFAYFPAQFLEQHRGPFLLPDEPTEQPSH